MYQKNLIFVLSLFIHYVGYSQSMSKIYIYDKEYGVPIEDASIVLKNGKGGISDRNGMFEFSLRHPDTITVSHISYQTVTTIAKMKSIDTLFLDYRFYEMPAITVSPRHFKRIGITSHTKKQFGRLYTGQEISQKFKLSESPSKLLDIKFPILDMNGADSVLVKAVFLNITDAMPGKKINNHQVLFIVDQQKNVSIDLNAYDIVMDEDFALSMQIMKVYANNIIPGESPYISIPVKINLVGEIFTRTARTGWKKKKGGSLSINILTSY